MLKKSNLLLIFIATSFFASASCAGLDDFCPYVGVDAQLRFMPFDSDHGAKVFKKRFTQGNLFAGFKWNDCLGLEAGYEASIKTKRKVSLLPGQITFGEGVPNLQTRNSTARIYGPHINLLGYYPIEVCSNLQLVGLLGLAHLKVRLESTILTINGIPLPLETRTFAQSKLVLRAGGGLQHLFSDQFGMRGMLMWENTNRFNRVLIKQDGFSSSSYAKLKSSILLSIGLFFNF